MTDELTASASGSAPADLIERQQEAAEQEWVIGWLDEPKRTRSDSLPVQVGDPAPDLTLPDMTGAPRWLSESWPAGPTLLLFLRHYGCSCLAERWDLLREEIPDLVTAGAQGVAVGRGEGVGEVGPGPGGPAGGHPPQHPPARLREPGRDASRAASAESVRPPRTSRGVDVRRSANHPPRRRRSR